MLDTLEAAGVDTIDFGQFGEASFSGFDFERATPVLIEWLPRVDDPRVKDAMVRSLAGQRGARGEGTRRLIAEFNRPDYAEQGLLRWSIGNTLATLSGPGDADALIEILRDRSAGSARQMVCDAMSRTGDPRRIDVLIELLDDDTVAGHAILALRRFGRGVLPQRERVIPMLEALIARPSSTPFGRRMARAALKKAASLPGLSSSE